MQVTINAKGYELSLAFSKKQPGPAVVVSEGHHIHVNDVAEMFRLTDRQQAMKYAGR